MQNTGEQQEKDVDAQDENADDVEKEESDENTAKNNLVNEKKVSDLEIIKDAENNTHPPPTMEYTCKACRKDFDKRPDVIMHIITQHMQDRFGDLPELLNNKYHCPHEECSYSASKRNALLAHLTLKHTAVKITEVTDLIIHNEDDQIVKAVVEADDKSNSSNSNEDPSDEHKEEIKKETVDQPLPVHITTEDNADVTWKCKICKKPFVSEELVRQHVLLFHLQDKFDQLAPKDKKIFSCDKCFKYSTVSRISYIKHIGMVHHAVSEEVFNEHIEQCKTLLLDIDVIKCSCGKKFDKQKQLRDHIIFTHCKHKFRHIPKVLNSYKCQDYHAKCTFVSDSRVVLVKHCISEHKAVSEEEFAEYMTDAEVQDIIAVEDTSSIESIDNDDSLIGFNDSVSQAANPHATAVDNIPELIDIDEETMDTNLDRVPFDNNSSHKCPICYKTVVQRSNFEDHLQTHGIQNDPVFHCHECNFASSFGQMYCHLSLRHQQGPVVIECLCCQEKMSSSNSQECIKQLKDHCINKEKRLIHHQNAVSFNSDLENQLYSKFR